MWDSLPVVRKAARRRLRKARRARRWASRPWRPTVMFRQGDVLLVRVRSTPWDAAPVARRDGDLVVAAGELTGHAHRVSDESAELLSSERAQELYLIVNGRPATLAHEEHDPIELPQWIYRVVRQRELAPDASREWRRVAD